MPLLTSKNIWCPCLPHRLICNTFCCCFHLTNIARINNNLHSLIFMFLYFSRCCSCWLFGLTWSYVWCCSAGSLVKTSTRCRCCIKIWSSCKPPPPSPPRSLLLLRGLDLVVVIPQRRLRSLVYWYTKSNEKIHQKHLQTKRALH